MQIRNEGWCAREGAAGGVMGNIRPEVLSDHLHQYSYEHPLIQPFSEEFDVTWAARRTAYGTGYSVYLLRPDETISKVFGLELEVALFIFDYDPMEARTIQAINQAMQESPLAGRAEPSLYIIIGRGERTGEWVAHYTARHPDPRSAVPLSFATVKGIKNRFELRRELAKTLHRRDLFDYRLPVPNDLFFFGRAATISKMRDQIKKGQNTGLFGLRKTGKTSVLYKLARDAQTLRFANIVYIDCKSPVIRKKRADELIAYLNAEIAKAATIPLSRAKKANEYETFSEIVRLATKKLPLCLVFDEIEFISPVAKLDPHWHTDFVDLWQMIWSTQSVHTGLSFVIGGVNAGVCESPTYAGVQNPLFSIVNIEYLRGLESDALARMVKYFGAQMGLRFSDDAIAVLVQHYGGHPLLTRLACSFVHQSQERTGAERPLAVTGVYLASVLPECDAQISAYCAHVVSELKEFYPDEYDVLMMASVGQRSEFMDYAREAEFTEHLLSYGVLEPTLNGLPTISLPVLRSFLAKEFARSSGGRIPREIVPAGRRSAWVDEVALRIVTDMRRVLQALPRTTNSPFAARGVPDLDIWSPVRLVESRDEFESFISRAYKVFYENIVRAMPVQADYEGWFKSDWPALYDAVRRIKTYRDMTLHLDVSDRTRQRYEDYLAVDLGGRQPDTVADGWFGLQQAVLDELLYAVQTEGAARAA
nr:hypothetical protein [Brevundimonas diminuta]